MFKCEITLVGSTQHTYAYGLVSSIIPKVSQKGQTSCDSAWVNLTSITICFKYTTAMASHNIVHVHDLIDLTKFICIKQTAYSYSYTLIVIYCLQKVRERLRKRGSVTTSVLW